MTEIKKFAQEQEAGLIAEFNAEFPGKLEVATVTPSGGKLRCLWARVVYLKGDTKRYAMQEVSVETLNDKARRSAWMEFFFGMIRYDLERDA